MRTESLEFLRRLLDTPSPSGHETAGQRVWLAEVRDHASRVWNDAYGNCFARLDCDHADAPTVAVCGHADEIGLMVNNIDDKGFVYCRQIGGIDPGSIVGKRIHFASSVPGVTDAVLGVIGATAIHLQDRSRDGKVRKLHELFVDIGCRSKEEAEERLNVGDPGVFADRSELIGDDTILARGLDNRIGTWAAAETIRRLAPDRAALKCNVVAVSTVQEEVGLVGAAMIAEGLKPDVALVTDVGHATDTPGIDRNRHGDFKLAGGPKVAIGGPAQPLVVAKLLAAAEREEITIQRSAVPGRSGTDTDAIFLRNGGIPSGLVSLPIRYMHTTVEMTSLADLDAIAAIFTRFCRDLETGESFVPTIA
ncbi:MAG: ABC transporter ATP-binding protein [Planctomycetaceae bacterium]|nr:ABC transporter ATP-binding protein [Planctomycetaceae bacterium]